MRLGESERERKECSQGSRGETPLRSEAASFTAPVLVVVVLKETGRKRRHGRSSSRAAREEGESVRRENGTVPTSIKCSERREGLTRNSFPLCHREIPAGSDKNAHAPK